MIDSLHRCARRLVRPGGALAACRVRREVVELDSVRAGQIARRLRSQLQQIHPDRFAREIPVAAHFESPIALRNHLTAPCRLHGRPPSIWAELNSVVALREKLQDARTAERPYLPPPPKKPLASRRICDRMNGSGSAPITIDPGWPQGVQQTTLPGGVFRYTPGVP